MVIFFFLSFFMENKCHSSLSDFFFGISVLCSVLHSVITTIWAVFPWFISLASHREQDNDMINHTRPPLSFLYVSMKFHIDRPVYWRWCISNWKMNEALHLLRAVMCVHSHGPVYNRGAYNGKDGGLVKCKETSCLWSHCELFLY